MKQEDFGEVMQTVILLEAANYDIGFNAAQREGLNPKAKRDRLVETRDLLRRELEELLRKI